tara:strand:- start:9034 stop:9402 length:369 start_codon:yes stop_codon:yes gene_type:complete
LSKGFRSGFEADVIEHARGNGNKLRYEDETISYIKPETSHTYLPDCILPNGVVVEIKGRLMKEDRQKHLLIKDQNPERDIRFCFQTPNNKIRKGSKTTYAMWCEKNDIKWCAKRIPQSWFDE